MKTDYYLEIECLPDEGLFSPSEIVKRKYDKHTQPEYFARMFHAIYQFGIRNGLPLEPDNGKRLPGGKLALTDKGRAELKPGERRAKWLGKTWKSKLYIEDREEIRQYAKELLINTLSQCLVKKHREEDAMRRKDEHIKKTVHKIRLKKGLMVAALVAAIVLTAGSLYNYSFLHEGFGILRNQGPKAAFEFFQNRGESYDNMFGQAWTAYRNTDYQEAEKLSQQVLKSRSLRDQARAWYLLAILKTIDGQFGMAEENYLNAAGIYESLDEKLSLRRTYIGLARLFILKKDTHNATYYTNLADSTFSLTNDSIYLWIKSQIAFLQNDFNTALLFSLDREKISNGDQSRLAGVYSDIAFYYGLLGYSDKCLEYTTRAQSMASEQEDILHIMYNNLNMYLYLKCTMKDYLQVRDSILAYAKEKSETKLFEMVYFIDKFNCPIPRTDPAVPDPPDDPPPSAGQTASNRNDSGQKPAPENQDNPHQN